ncbi:MAG: ABC transporter permease, partial [Chloroflexi bacterium]|nr:ABC transporter permease [Chloroflexota bacterium]
MAYQDEAAVALGEMEQPAPSMASRWRSGIWFFIRRKPLGAFGALVLIFVLTIALFSPWIAQFGYSEPHFPDKLLSPNSTYWFGTDNLGRDVFTRVVIGSQITILVGIGTVALAAVLSVLVGGVSGYFGGRVDMVVQRFVDIWVALP